MEPIEQPTRAELSDKLDVYMGHLVDWQGMLRILNRALEVIARDHAKDQLAPLRQGYFDAAFALDDYRSIVKEIAKQLRAAEGDGDSEAKQIGR